MSKIFCVTGKKRYERGDCEQIWCQDCNGFHDQHDKGTSLIKSIRTVAFMLRNDEIEKRDAALALFLLTEPISERHHFHHD